MDEDKEDVDGRSVYIGNVSPLDEQDADTLMLDRSSALTCLCRVCQVDYASTPEEIQGHFAACGQINRVTILCDKFTGHPKGYVHASSSLRRWRSSGPT